MSATHRHGRFWAYGAVCALLTCVPACDIPPERAGVGPTVLASDPADGATGVDRAARLRVFLDRPLLPRDVHRGRVRVASGTRTVFLAPRFDPVDLVLTLDPSALDPAVRYRMTLDGVRDLDRVALAEPFSTTFQTGEASVGEPREPIPWARVEPIFAACASAGCHGAEAPAVGLDLSSPEGVRATAIGVAALGSRVGVQAEDPWRGASTLDGLARLDVVGGIGRPSRSYLLYKLLGDPHVSGERMPPSPAAPLERAELRLISSWIASGCRTE